MTVTFSARPRTVLTSWREALDRAASARDWAAAGDAAWAAGAAARAAAGAARAAAWDAWVAAWDAAEAAWVAAGEAAEAAAGDAVGSAEYPGAISQASAWYEEYERLCGGRAYYRACCWAAGDACQYVEFIHHDGLSAWMCEECWYCRLEDIEIDKPADEREERLWRMEIAAGGR